MNNYYQDINIIEPLMGKKIVTMDIQDTLLAYFRRDKAYEDYFFKNTKNISWFSVVRKWGYFEPENFIKNEKGKILLPRSFDYLEWISGQVSDHQEYGKELIDIIENVIRYFQENEKINNYYVWWSCVKILNNLPSDIIKENLALDDQSDDGKTKYGFRTWLKTWMNFPHGNDIVIPELGEKLSAKFLDAANMADYAQAIVEAITEICPDTRRKSAFGENEAVMVWDSYWILDAFKKLNDKIAAICSDEAVYHIANQLKKALEYKQKDTWTDIQVGGNLYYLKCSRVGKGDLKENEIAYEDSEYSVLIKQYSPEQIKGIDIKNDFLSLRKIEPDKILVEFTFKANDKVEFVSEVKTNLPPGINWESAEKFEKKLGHLFSNLYSDYSYIWFKSLKSDSIINPRDAEEVLAVILHDLLLSFCKLDADKAKSTLKKLLGDQYKFPIFRRMFLLCLDKYWDNYSELLERFLESASNVLAETDYELELQDVLSNHGLQLSLPVNAKLKELITDVPEYYRKKGPKFIAYWQYKWLSPLKDNPTFSPDYAEARKKAQIKEDKPYEPDRSPAIASFVENKSPLTIEQILGMEIVDLIKYLLDFKGTDDWGMLEGKPDKRGLADMLQAAVKEKPEKFINDLKQFNQQGLYFYVNSVLRGFWECLRAGRPLSWDKILRFSSDYINQPWFIDEAFQAQGEDKGHSKGEYVWVLDNIADLIKEGSRDDERAISSQDDFILAKKIFADMFMLIKRGNDPDADRDALTYAINTTLGRTIESFIVFSLRVKRFTKKEEENWGENKYKPLFDKGWEAYTWFGHYLPNIRYLDKTFADKKVEELVKLDAKDKKWQSFMGGCLFGAYVYDDIYKKMKDHYIKALKNKIFDDQADKRLVQHIAIGYLRGHESLEEKDSLFYKMLNEADTAEKRGRWFEIVNFFWSISG
ncbi:MAG: hypothetical protein HQ596_06025, partial [Candidatus Saganbacteria bacterium]|nr:hypothetical protein [Candidatus Saganbacteria bacterium]